MGGGYVAAALCSGNNVNIVLRQFQWLTILSLSQMIAVAEWPMSGTRLHQSISLFVKLSAIKKKPLCD